MSSCAASLPWISNAISVWVEAQHHTDQQHQTSHGEELVPQSRLPPLFYVVSICLIVIQFPTDLLTKKNRSMTDKQLSTDTAAKCSHDGTAAGDPANATARTAAGTVITSLDKEFRVTTRLLQPAACIVQDNSTDWLLFARTLWIYLPNLTFLALPIPEIIGGTSKSSGVPGYAHAPFSPTILISICSHEPSEYDTTRYWTLMTYSAR